MWVVLRLKRECSQKCRLPRLNWSFIFGILLASFAFKVPVSEGRFAARLSLGVGEEYNDNIFFSSDNKEHDFVTFIVPTLSLFYAPPSEVAPTFNFNISPTGSIYARHSFLNSFGFNENAAMNTGYTFNYSPRLNFKLSESLRHTGKARTSLGPEPPSKTELFPVAYKDPTGQIIPIPGVFIPIQVPGLRADDFLANGSTLTNYFSLHGNYQYSPNTTFTGGYSSGLTLFRKSGGSEISNSFSLRGNYKWRQAHNLHAGYTLTLLKSRDGETNPVHNFDVGDNYFSSRTIQLSPTLTLSASSGLSLNLGGKGPRVGNTLNVALRKLWETAIFTTGVRKGLTESFGVSGISDTTSLFSLFNIRLTEKLWGTAGANFSLFNTEDVNFKVFQAQAGLSYSIRSWLTSNLRYVHRWRNAGRGAERNDLLTRGDVRSNSVSVVLTAHFDIWPNVGLAKQLDLPAYSPLPYTPDTPAPTAPSVGPTPPPENP